MENRLDNLFRDKLSKQEINPTPGAWGQIEGQLQLNRLKLWGKRLAIAASVILISTVGIMSYRLLNNQTAKKDQPIALSIEESAFVDEQVVEQPKSVNDEEFVIMEIETDNKRKDGPGVVKNSTNKTTNSNVIHLESETDKKASVPLLAIAKPIEEAPVENENIIENEALQDNEIKISNEPEKELISENSFSGEVHGVEKSKERKKHPKVTIIYKADKNSVIVASDKKNIMDKGIDKLSNFSNEHLLTVERKTKLRNTKEDLLALNFSKLINRSNKEIEN